MKQQRPLWQSIGMLLLLAWIVGGVALLIIDIINKTERFPPYRGWGPR
jgi:hypothetical protein